MKERPILFSAPMVRAILDGSKTQTRRIAKSTQFSKRFHALSLRVGVEAAIRELPPNSPYGIPGDRLWVRETWFDNLSPREEFSRNGIVYRATHDCHAWEDGCPCNPDGDGKRSEWRASIHMPRWASRLTLEVVSGRVERLNALSESDACADGGFSPFTRDCKVPKFRELWERINGDGSWDTNPWVWVVEFRRLT